MHSRLHTILLVLVALFVFCSFELATRTKRQLAPVDVFVLERASPPAMWTNVLSGTGSSLLTNYRAAIPYERAVDKKVSASDIAAIRRQLAWSFIVPQHPAVISVESSNAITVTCEIDDSHCRVVHFEKIQGRWKIVNISTGIY